MWSLAAAGGEAVLGASEPDPIFDLDSMPKLPDQAPKAVDKQPVPLVQGHPQYPFQLRAAGLEGCALVDFIIATDETVRDAKAVLETNAKFAAAAVAAVTRWQFSPGLRQGRPVNVHMQVSMIFSLAPEPGIAGDASAQLSSIGPMLDQAERRARRAGNRLGRSQPYSADDLSPTRLHPRPAGLLQYAGRSAGSVGRRGRRCRAE